MREHTINDSRTHNNTLNPKNVITLSLFIYLCDVNTELVTTTACDIHIMQIIAADGKLAVHMTRRRQS